MYIMKKILVNENYIVVSSCHDQQWNQKDPHMEDLEGTTEGSTAKKV
jgi:hypothetical protein